MIMQAGTTYAVSLIAKFNGTLDGVYNVVMITTFEDAIASGISFVDKLYTPAGLTESDYNADYNTYAGTTVYVCKSVTDATVVLYVPESAVSGYPDPTVVAYNRVLLIVDAGYMKDPSVVTPLVSMFADQTVGYLGITNAVSISVDSSRRKYMTRAEYTAYRAGLDRNKTSVTSLTQTITTLTAENQDLRDRLAAYEGAVIAAQKG